MFTWTFTHTCLVGLGSGEIYAALTKHTILNKLMDSKAAHSEDAFMRGVVKEIHQLLTDNIHEFTSINQLFSL